MQLRLSIRVLSVLMMIAAIAAVGTFSYVTSPRWDKLESTCEQICRWAKEQPLAVGAHPRLHIPLSLALPSGSEINLVKTARGDLVVLVKTYIGWKGNYEGVLYSTRPIDPSEISDDGDNRKVIDIPGIEFDPPVIRERMSPQFFRVYFDLG